MLDSKEIVEIIEDMDIILEERTIDIIQILSKGEIISENEIAEKLELKINAARKSLYQLHTIGFVEYTKEKDEEKKWWYIYFWELNKKKLIEIYKKYKENLLKTKQKLILSEREFSFQSKDGEQKFTYEDALANGFVNPENNAPLVEINNLELISQLEQEVHQLNTNITEIAEKLKEVTEIEAKKAALALIKDIKGKKAIVSAEKVSGILRKL